jgi:hypothetical protein
MISLFTAFVKLRACDCNILELTEDIRELHADKFNVLFLRDA